MLHRIIYYLSHAKVTLSTTSNSLNNVIELPGQENVVIRTHRDYGRSSQSW